MIRQVLKDFFTLKSLFYLFLIRFFFLQRSSIASNSTVIVENSPRTSLTGLPVLDDMELAVDNLHLHPENMSSRRLAIAQSLLRSHAPHSSTDSDVTHPYGRGKSRAPPKPKHFYKYWLWPSSKFLKIRFDRLALLAALDR